MSIEAVAFYPNPLRWRFGWYGPDASDRWFCVGPVAFCVAR
jgi:hypothetical protein